MSLYKFLENTNPLLTIPLTKCSDNLDRKELKEGVESYVLHFCSREMFRNMRHKVSKAYNGELSTSAVQIYTDESKLDGKKQLINKNSLLNCV